VDTKEKETSINSSNEETPIERSEKLLIVHEGKSDLEKGLLVEKN